jgi:hypothetical protein
MLYKTFEFVKIRKTSISYENELTKKKKKKMYLNK